jgi:hypothetical protein
MRALLFLCFGTSVFAQQDEIVAVNHLIEATQKRVVAQQVLREKMLLFYDQKERFIQGDESKLHASQMVRTAHQILSAIREQRLQYLFSSQYLEELALFSSIAEKNKPTRP